MTQPNESIRGRRPLAAGPLMLNVAQTPDLDVCHHQLFPQQKYKKGAQTMCDIFLPGIRANVVSSTFIKMTQGFALISRRRGYARARRARLAAAPLGTNEKLLQKSG